jgi:predicted house-cleaning noncanonical NTP pyrophosphatase (MazG superfamily)
LKIDSTADLASLPGLREKHRNVAVLLAPKNVEVLRNNDFLKAVAKATVPDNVPVYLGGSTLAHAYYQLRACGCTIVPLSQKDHQRVRRQETLGKLVRDKIPDRIASKQERQVTARVPRASLTPFLIAKAVEEFLEVRQAVEPQARLLELADVYEALRALASEAGHDMTAVVQAADEKRACAGGIENGTVLLETGLPPSAPNAPLITEAPATWVLSRLLPGGNGYAVPFTYFGFAEIDGVRTLTFPEYGLAVPPVTDRQHRDHAR